MKMCYRGVEYDRSSVFVNLGKQQKEALDRNLANVPTIQMKFMGQFFDKQVFSLASAKKNIRFMGRNCNRCVVNATEAQAIA